MSCVNAKPVLLIFRKFQATYSPMAAFDSWTPTVCTLFCEFHLMNSYLGLGFPRSRWWDENLSANNLCGGLSKRILVEEWKNKAGKEKASKVV